MQLPEIVWFTVDNPPMTDPVTIRILRGPDGRRSLTLERGGTSVGAVLHREEVGQVRRMLAVTPDQVQG